MLVKVGKTWINPEAITHITAWLEHSRVHLLSGTYTDLSDITPDEVVAIIAKAYKPDLTYLTS